MPSRPKVHPNLYKYKVHPPAEMVNKIISESGMNLLQFEFAHSMYSRALKHFKSGYRNIPVQYWHIFYEPGKKPPTFEWMFKKILEERYAVFQHKNRRLKKEKRPKTNINAHPQLQKLVS